MSPHSAKTLCALAIFAVASQSASAQSTADLLGRKFITPSDLANAQNPMAPAAQPQLAPSAQSPLAPLDYPQEPAQATARQSPAQAAPAPAASPAPAARPAAIAQPTPAAAPAPLAARTPEAAQPPRYVADSSYNMGSMSHHSASGEKLDSKMAAAYAARAPSAAPASASREGMKASAPSVAILRSLGVEQGKIDMELNRLTPSQLQRWAEEARR